MEILVSPPAEVLRATRGDRSGACAMSPRSRENMSVLVTALSALYEVQARLWSIPDKAEVLPGISLSVTRRPFDAVVISLPPCAGAPVMASALCAARALGISRIAVSGVERGAHDVDYLLDVFGVDREEAPGAVAVDWSRPLPAGIAIVADDSARADEVARLAKGILECGHPLDIVTCSASLASWLPAQLGGSGGAAVRIVLYPDAPSLLEPLEELRPAMIVAEIAEARELPKHLSFAAGILAGPVPDLPHAAALATMVCPIFPIHELTCTHALIDPITARP